MPAATAKKDQTNNVTIVKKMRDYSKEPAFKKKAENAIKFLKKHGLPESFKKKK
jgi:ribosomal protein L31E